jgi:hypothetical protein
MTYDPDKIGKTGTIGPYCCKNAANFSLIQPSGPGAGRGGTAPLCFSFEQHCSGHALTQAGSSPSMRRPWHMAHLPKGIAGGRFCSGTDLLGAFGSDHEVWEGFRRLESETYAGVL